MSFTHEPFTHFQIDLFRGKWFITCESCGWGRAEVHMGETIQYAIRVYFDHLKTSHDLLPPNHCTNGILIGTELIHCIETAAKHNDHTGRYKDAVIHW